MPSGAYETAHTYPCWKARHDIDARCALPACLQRARARALIACPATASRLHNARCPDDGTPRAGAADECGNDPCFKLADPALKPDAATRRATFAMALGGSLMLGGLCLCCGMSFVLTRKQKALLRAATEERAVPTVKVMQASTADYGQVAAEPVGRV
jgi:hypothetical protein